MYELITYDPAKHAAYLQSFVDINIACIMIDFTNATFLPPLRPEVMLAWYETRAAEVAAGSRSIFMALGPGRSPNKTADGGEGVGAGELVGFVMLSKPFSETGPFRALVEKLLISPEHRRRGIAKRLMANLEVSAKADWRTLLILDTEEGSPAENVYPRLGYTTIGRIPNHSYSPKDGRLVHEVYYYKDLGTPETSEEHKALTKHLQK